MLLNIMIAGCIGGCMGLLGHAKRQGKIEKPRITKRFIYPGFIEEVIIGSIAAVLIVVSSGAESLSRVVFLSILAGYGGEQIIQGISLVRHVPSKEVIPVEQNQVLETSKTNEPT
ncbi:DUF4257 domain-containing protein [Fredinandcohnia humi]